MHNICTFDDHDDGQVKKVIMIICTLFVVFYHDCPYYNDQLEDKGDYFFFAKSRYRYEKVPHPLCLGCFFCKSIHLGVTSLENQFSHKNLYERRVLSIQIGRK